MPFPSDLIAWTKQLVRQYHLRPGQRLGQHFLVDRTVLSSIIKAAALPPGAHVLEVGGGLGVLTLELLTHSSKVAVVELDNSLALALHKIAATTPKLQVIKGDILKLSDRELQMALNLKPEDDYWLVANLPYEISGVFLRRFLSGSWLPKTMVLLLQAEVAERLLARSGQNSLLTLQAWLSGQVEIIRKVNPDSFYPPPRVASAIVRFKLRSPSERVQLVGARGEGWLWTVARAGFSSRRKFLLGNLSRQLKMDKSRLVEVFDKVDLPLTVRAQELDLEQWLKLARALDK